MIDRRGSDHLWLLLLEEGIVLHIRGGVRTSVRDGRAGLPLLLQGEI